MTLTEPQELHMQLLIIQARLGLNDDEKLSSIAQLLLDDSDWIAVIRNVKAALGLNGSETIQHALYCLAQR